MTEKRADYRKEQQQKKMEEYLQLAIEVAKENAMPLEKITEILKILYLEDE